MELIFICQSQVEKKALYSIYMNEKTQEINECIVNKWINEKHSDHSMEIVTPKTMNTYISNKIYICYSSMFD